MRFRRALGLFALAAGLVLSNPATAMADTPTWGIASLTSFGTGVQNPSPEDFSNAVSCATPGNCTAVGYFNNAVGGRQAFARTSTNGVWADAVPVTFADGVEQSPSYTYMTSVSCSAPGYCTAAGSFKNVLGKREAFTVTATNGAWADAVPATFGAGVRNASPYDGFYAISCGSAGNCTAAGFYNDPNWATKAFTQTSTNGVWAEAVPADFPAGLENSDSNTNFEAISCSAPGYCTAVGAFKNAISRYEYQGFSQTSTNGVWAPIEVVTFGAGVESSTPDTQPKRVSCSSAGNCVLVGYFVNAAGYGESFTRTMTSGVWAPAVPVAFAAGVNNASANDETKNVSCASDGNCTVVGYFNNNAGFRQAFTQTMTGGVWANAEPVSFPTGTEDATPASVLDAVSCASAGNCTAVGTFKSVTGGTIAFVVTSINGVWGQPLPLSFPVDVQNSPTEVYTSGISCKSAGVCTVTGAFRNASGRMEAYQVSSTALTLPPTGSSAILLWIGLIVLAAGAALVAPTARRAAR